MRPYFASKGGTLKVPEGSQELSEQQLAPVAGGATHYEAIASGFGTGAAPAMVTPAAVAAV